MKKILFSLLMLCSMTAALAGEGTGTKGDPFRGEWDASVLVPELNEGDHLAYDCVISGGWITVYDDKLDQTKLTKFISQWETWAVGSPISKDPKDDSGVVSFKGLYDDYCDINSLAERQKHTFIVTKKELPNKNTYSITGHYSGCYDRRGDGSKDYPYTGEWEASELGPELEPGKYLAFDCVIKNGAITVKDSRLNKEVVNGESSAWTPGDLIENPQSGSPYEQYGKDNPLANRKGQSFIITKVNPGNAIDIEGYFSGFYTTPDADGFVYVESAEQMWIVLHGNSNVKANDHAKVKLTQDIYLSDIAEGTYCDAFYGTLDGDGHTINGDHVDVRRHCTRLFTYSYGATIKNLTFRGIRVDSEDDHGVVVSQAEGCTFQNITFDNVSIYADESGVGAVSGRVEFCIFENITVKNSDLTTNRNGCGGIVGYTLDSKFHNCYIDDHTFVFSNRDDGGLGQAGGIAGWSSNDEFINCINSGVVASNGFYVGGIVGYAAFQTKMEGCLNTGIVMTTTGEKLKKFQSDLYGKLPVTKRTYGGKIYDVRTGVSSDSYKADIDYVGGMVGYMDGTSVSRCANIGYMACRAEESIGGIAGHSSASSISDCLVAYMSDNNKGGGIIGVGAAFGSATDIKNCLSIPNTNVEFFHGDINEPSNNYSICAADKGKKGVTVIQESMLATGEAVTKLGSSWEQEIGVDAYPTPTGNRGLYHTRKVSNQYGTVCFPFAVKSDDKISYYTLNAEKHEGQDIKLVFKYVEENHPGFPVLFRAAEAKDADADNPVEICFSNAGDGFTRDPQVNFSLEDWWLYGTFEQKVFEETNSFSLMSPEYVYYVSGGQIRNAKKVTIAPYRAWFHGPNIKTLTGNGTNQAKSILFVIEDEDGETTEIKLADFNENQNFNFNGNFNGKTYSIMGTQVNENYRGIVIKNGKKIICE